MIDESQITEEMALRVLNREYFADVRGVGDDIKERLVSGEITREEVYDAIHESVDGHQRVIYTYQAVCSLCCTDHRDAYEEETGEKPPSVEAQLCYAMIQDVSRYLGDVDALPSAEDAETEAE